MKLTAPVVWVAGDVLGIVCKIFLYKLQTNNKSLRY